MRIKICPSLQDADLTRLADVVAELEEAGVDGIHVDVADGHFAPNIIFGPYFARAVASCASVPVGVHLMITNPARYAPHFVEAGAEDVLFHGELDADLVEIARCIRDAGGRPGAALKPDTDPAVIEPLVGEVDCLMAMTVQPGFSGQGFMESACHKIPALRQMFGSDIDIYVDGGIGPDTVGTAVRYGANVMVASSAVFKADVPPGEAVRRLREAAEKALEPPMNADERG
ncbi:MAG: ribulose-phosphate 3-epimerase [Candidatus Brocadiia bacterium]